MKAAILCLKAQFSAELAFKLVLAPELKLFVVGDYGRVMAYLHVFGSIKGETLVKLEVILITLLGTTREKVIDLRIDLVIDVQVMYNTSCTVLHILRARVNLEAIFVEFLDILQVQFWVVLKDEKLADVFSDEHVAALAFFIGTIIRCSGEQNYPPQAQEETN